MLRRRDMRIAGRSAARRGALQNRHLRERKICDDPGSAVHRTALHRGRETDLRLK